MSRSCCCPCHARARSRVRGAKRKVLEALGDAEVTALELVERTGLLRHTCRAAASKLARVGLLEHVGWGVYRAVQTQPEPKEPLAIEGLVC